MTANIKKKRQSWNEFLYIYTRRQHMSCKSVWHFDDDETSQRSMYVVYVCAYLCRRKSPITSMQYTDGTNIRQKHVRCRFEIIPAIDFFSSLSITTEDKSNQRICGKSEKSAHTISFVLLDFCDLPAPHVAFLSDIIIHGAIYTGTQARRWYIQWIL